MKPTTHELIRKKRSPLFLTAIAAGGLILGITGTAEHAVQAAGLVPSAEAATPAHHPRSEGHSTPLPVPNKETKSGEAPFGLATVVEGQSGLTAGQLDSALEGTGLAGLGGDFVRAEQHFGIRADFMAAHAAIESQWGTSNFARDRNNLFGFNAVDSNPNLATAYASKAESINAYSELIRNHYLTPGADHYYGTTIHDIFVDYSTSHDAEGVLVADIMKGLDQKARG